jgi:hypothetical protein
MVDHGQWEDRMVATTHTPRAEGRVRAWAKRVVTVPTARDAAWALVAIAGASVLVRLVLVSIAHAPVVFSDELGYEKLAESIGRTAHLGLFDNRGLSYSPFYPVILSPIFALGVSAPSAYTLIKVTNAVLMSLSILPVYKIARFVLPRRSSLVVAALSAAAPLMFYASFSMSENLAYPLCLCAIWASLAAVRTPNVRNDALLLVSLLAAGAARTQLIVLVPAALTAIFLGAALEAAPTGLLRRLVGALGRHPLLLGAVGAALFVAAAGALAGKGVASVFGRYAVVFRTNHPEAGRVIKMLAWHTAGIDLAVGVVPFIAAIVCTVVFARRRFRGKALPFAAVAVSVSVWLLLEVAYDAARFDGGSDVPRIHERFLIYVFPLFIVALIACVHIPEPEVSSRLYLVASAIGVVLLVAIPFHTVISQVSAIDTFGLQPLAHVSGGKIVPLPHTTLVALAGATVLALLFFRVRTQLRATATLVLIPLLFIGSQEMNRISAGSLFARSKLPARTDWVDAANPHGNVVLLTAAEDPTPALETAYSNYSITSLYYLCRPVAGSEFGEKPATIGPSGALRGASGSIAASYVVAPVGLGVRGRVVARNPKGHQVLVAPVGAGPSVAPQTRLPLGCVDSS